MHGFLIHTNDQRLLVRNYDYLKYENPGWWQDNLAMVSSFWEFDSDKPALMKAVFESLSRVSRHGLLPFKEVREFCASINYDLPKFMEENRTPEAHMSKVEKQNWDTNAKGATGGFVHEASFNPHNTKPSGD